MPLSRDVNDKVLDAVVIRARYSASVDERAMTRFLELHDSGLVEPTGNTYIDVELRPSRLKV